MLATSNSNLCMLAGLRVDKEDPELETEVGCAPAILNLDVHTYICRSYFQGERQSVNIVNSHLFFYFIYAVT